MVLIRVVGGAFVVLGLLPGFLVLDPSRVGPYGQWVLALEAGALELVLWGSLTVCGLGFLLARTVGDSGIRSALGRLGRWLERIPDWILACGLGLASAVAAGAIGVRLSGGLPTYVDSVAHLLQARFMAEGMMAGPVPDPVVSQIVINTLISPEGWISLYPPAHTLLLAGGLATGAAAWIGPMLTGLTVGLASLFFIEVLPERPGTARLAALLTAFSPFILLLGSGYLSHTSCAAGVALAAWSGSKARTGSWSWAVVAGAGTGMAVASRPWTALVLLSVLLPALWLPGLGRRNRPVRWLLSRVGGAAAGGAPFGLLLLGYNLRFFGGAFTLGYGAAYGPAHGLGFHSDPWGFPYGLREALGYTASDLSSLSIHLLEAPLPLVALVGVFLVAATRIPRGAAALTAWAAAPVLANFFYWHHGFHLGPRMLYEAAPAWAGLTALAVGWMAWPTGDEGDESTERRGEGCPPAQANTDRGLRTFFLWTFVVAVAGPVGLVPARLSANAWDAETRARVTPPDPGEEPAIVFVHESWSERVSARLQASGIRLDSMEVAFRRNGLCALDRYSRARLSGAPVPELDFTAAPEPPGTLQEVETQSGQRIQVDPATALSPECARELRADRSGTVSLAPLLWQGDLRGADEGRVVFVRDLGPEANQAALEAWPGRTPYLFVPTTPDGEPILRPYSEAVEALW